MARTKVSSIPQPPREIFEKVLQQLEIPPASIDSMRRWLPAVLWRMAHEWLNQCDENEGRTPPEIPTFPSEPSSVPLKRARPSLPIFLSVSTSTPPSHLPEPPSSPSALNDADLEVLRLAMLGAIGKQKEDAVSIETISKEEVVSQELSKVNETVAEVDVKIEQAQERQRRYEARQTFSPQPQRSPSKAELGECVSGVVSPGSSVPQAASTRRRRKSTKQSKETPALSTLSTSDSAELASRLPSSDLSDLSGTGDVASRADDPSNANINRGPSPPQAPSVRRSNSLGSSSLACSTVSPRKQDDVGEGSSCRITRSRGSGPSSFSSLPPTKRRKLDDSL